MTRKIWISLALLLIVAAAAAWYFARPAPQSSSGLVQEASAEMILNHVKELKSPLVLINFWASWCDPCKEEFPSLLAAKKEFENAGLRVVFVSVDDVADRDAAEEFLKQQQVTFPTFYKGTQSLNFVADIFPQWTGAVPATVLMGPDLKILDSWEGDTSLEELQKRVKEHLKGT